MACTKQTSKFKEVASTAGKQSRKNPHYSEQASGKLSQIIITKESSNHKKNTLQTTES